MVSATFLRRSDESGERLSEKLPRLNVVAIAILVAAIVLGLVGWNATGNPVPLAVMALVGLVLMPAPRIA